MLKITFNPKFIKTISKIKNNELKIKIKKQIEKIRNNPKIGKPMKYSGKGTRELYIKPFRIAYAYYEEQLHLIFLKIYHKDMQ